MDIMTLLGSLIICSLGLLSLTKGQQVTIIPAEPMVKKFVNESYFVSCLTANNTYHAEWINPKGQKIDSSPQARIRSELLNGVDLFLTRITTVDAGKYTCRSTRSRSTAQFELFVIRPITFDNSHAEQWAEEGKNHLLKCKAQGHAQPSIHWKIDNRNVPTNMAKYKLTKEGLLIHNVTQSDATKSYVCRALDVSSPLPDSKQLNISLRVKMRPKFVSNLKNQHWGVLNEWANLTCAVVAEPRASFEWMYRERTLTPSDTVVIHNEENVSILQVLVRNESLFGSYDCKVRNEMGYNVQRMFLQKGRKPAAPKLEEVQVSADAAKIKVLSPNPTRTPTEAEDRRLGKILPVTGIVVQYKMQTKTEWSPANYTPYDNYQGFILNGLTPSVTYNVRAALRNQAAQGDFSHSQFFIKTVQSSSYTISTATSTLQYARDHHLIPIIGISLNFFFVNIVLLL